MTTWKFPGNLHLIPAYGTIIIILFQLLICCNTESSLHTADHIEVVTMPSYSLLNLSKQEANLHPYNNASHAQEYVAPYLQQRIGRTNQKIIAVQDKILLVLLHSKARVNVLSNTSNFVIKFTENSHWYVKCMPYDSVM